MADRYTVEDAVYLMQRLRDPQDGCPWDIKQSFGDITKYTIEECYELIDAIESEDFAHVEEELGDVLFQVVFYAQLGKEQSLFDFDSIIDKLVRKLVRRHPHVFPNLELRARFGHQPKETDDIKATWEAIKAEERAAKHKQRLLDDVPAALPALSRAQKLQKRASNVGMDWSNTDAVIAALESEIAELKAAMLNGDKAHIEEEAGDVLFASVNVARHLKLDAEQSLRHANNKFYQRISMMEDLAAEQGQSLDGLDEAQLDDLWKAAKRQLSSAYR